VAFMRALFFISFYPLMLCLCVWRSGHLLPQENRLEVTGILGCPAGRESGREPWRSGVSAERRNSWEHQPDCALPRRRYGETVYGKRELGKRPSIRGNVLRSQVPFALTSLRCV